MNQNYLVIDANSVVINVIVWDGVSAYDIESCTLEPQADGVWIGWRRDDAGMWQPPSPDPSE